jgi:hypothetical protein
VGEMKHIADKSITETLVRALENADRMKHVIVIFETIDSDPCSGFIFSDGETTLAQMNYMLDCGKQWIFDQ